VKNGEGKEKRKKTTDDVELFIDVYNIIDFFNIGKNKFERTINYIFGLNDFEDLRSIIGKDKRSHKMIRTKV
jgi:hypothetical protein